MHTDSHTPFLDPIPGIADDGFDEDEPDLEDDFINELDDEYFDDDEEFEDEDEELEYADDF